MEQKSDMKEIQHPHGDFLVIVVAMLKEIVQGIGVEEGRDGNEATSFLDIAPGHEFLVE